MVVLALASVGSAGAGTLWWEAEASAPKHAETRADPCSSGGGYLALPQRHEPIALTYRVEIAEDGNYQLDLRQTWPARSFRYRWGDGTWQVVDKPVWLDREMQAEEGVSWGWFTDGRFHKLAKGKQVLRLRLEPGGRDARGAWYPRTGFDCFALSADAFAPVSILRPGLPVPAALRKRHARSVRKLAFWSTARRLERVYSAGAFGKGEHVLPYRLLTPRQTEPGRRYPLVVGLPSSGGRGTDNVAQLGACEPASVLADAKARADRPCFVLVPQAPDWFSDEPRPRVTKTGLPMLTMLLELLDNLQETHPIDANRIYLTGQSLGGFGVCNAMRRDPNRFAAAVMVAGSMPERGKHFASTPTWVFVGEHDGRKGQALATVQAIRAAGGSAKLTILPDTGHVAWPKAYSSRELWDWLFAQRRTHRP
jgi:poly(3-hydroxybutyrate) depolymerase